MDNLNWEKLASVNIEELKDEELNQLYQQLTEIDIDDCGENGKLKILFRAAQAIMQAKSMQAELAMEELEQMTSRSTASKREQLLQNEIENLRKQLTVMESQPGSAKMRTLELQLEQLQAESVGKENQLAQEKREKDRYANRISDLEKDCRDLSNEIAHLKDELEDCKRQIDEQTDSSYQTTTKDQEFNVKIREKNSQIGRLLEDIEHMELQNGELQQKVVDLRDKLDESTKQMDKTTADYIQLKNANQQAEVLVASLRTEKVELNRQINDLIQQNQARILADDEIIAAVNRRVDEWKSVFSGKEALILKQQNEIKQLRDSLAVSSSSASKNLISVLSKTVGDRDKEIQRLKLELELATKDLGEGASIIENLKIKNLSGSQDTWQVKEIESLKRRLKQSEQSEAECKQRMKDAENHAQNKDEELTEALVRISQFELGEYGLADAVQEIKKYKVQLRLREQQIEGLNGSVNEMELALKELQEINEELCEKLGVAPKELCYAEIGAKIAAKNQKEKALNIVLQKEIETLEDERLRLKQDIRKLAQIVGQRASKYGLTAEDAKLLQAFAEKLCDEKRTGKYEAGEVMQSKMVLDEVTKQVKSLQDEVQITREKLADLPKRVLRQQVESRIQFSNTGNDDVDGLTLARCQVEMEAIRKEKAILDSELRKVKEENDHLHHELEDLKIKVKEFESNFDNSTTVKHENEADKIELDAISKVNFYIKQYVQSFDENSLSGHEGKINILREDLSNKLEKYNSDMKIFLNEKEAFEAEKMKYAIKLEEYEKLLDVLTKSDNIIKNEVADMSRKLTVSRMNEKNLINKCSVLTESEEMLSKTNTNLQNEILALQGAVYHRINYLEQFKNMAIFKIAALHRALDDSVSASEFQELDGNFHELMLKYQQLLKKNEDLLNKGYKSNQEEHEQLYARNEYLQGELQKCHETLHSLGYSKLSTAKDEIQMENSSNTKQIALLEMKEFHEHQRADHAVYFQNEMQQNVKKLNHRIEELEEMLAHVTNLNIEQGKIEKHLQMELEACIPKKEYDRVCLCLETAEATKIVLEKELSHLKEIADVAENQVSTIQIIYSAKLREVELLRGQVVNMQSGSDDKTLVGKLYRQLINVQISEAALQHKLEKCNSQLKKIEALSLRLEQRCDEKDRALYLLRSNVRIKVNQLKQIIRRLYHRFYGAIPLSKQEKITLELISVQNDRSDAKKELEEACKLRHKVEVQSLELEVKTNSLQELISTLKDGHGAKKVLEWHEKILDLRVEDMKKSHHIQNLSQDLEHEQKRIIHQEEIISTLEKKLAKMETDNEAQLFAWDNDELDRSFSRLEDVQTVSVSKIDVASSPLPDTSLPISEQLDQALQTIKSNSLSFLENQEHHKALQKKSEILQKRNNELEIMITAQNRVIEDLRHRHPASDNKLQSSDLPGSVTDGVTLDSGPAYKVAQAMVEGLKTRLFQKEETIVKYQELVKKAREDMDEMAANHQKEIGLIQAKIQEQTKRALLQLRREIQQNMINIQSSAHSSEQITKMNELQEIAVQQDTAISIMAEKLKASSKEIQHWQLKVDATAKEFLQEKEKMQEEHAIEVKKLEDALDATKSELIAKGNALQTCSLELEKQIIANKKAPSTTLKNILERLKKDVHVKEKQIQSLSTTLTELKNEMRSIVEEKACGQSAGEIEQSKIMAIVQSKTKTLQYKLDAALEENGRLRKDVKKVHPNSQLVFKLKEDLDKQIAISSELLQEKQNLSGVVKDLESKVKRISRTEESELLEVNLLRSKVKSLEDKLMSLNTPEKPYDKTKERKGSNSTTMTVEVWEETKKWQQALAKLKSKLSEKDNENAGLERSISTLKNIVSKIEKEKAALEKKLKLYEFGSTKSAAPTGNIFETFSQLYTANCTLNEEVTALKHQLFVEKDAIVEELKTKNAFLTNQIEVMKKMENASLSKKSSVALAEELNMLHQKENELQKEVIRLSQENLEMQFALQQAKSDLPQHLDRIKYLEAYVELLRSEQFFPKGALTSPRNPRVGVSGAGVLELEKTVVILKKVLERLQNENGNFKRRAQQSVKTIEILQEENKMLKDNQKFVESSIVTQQPPEASEKHISKIIAHNERLLHDLEKEVKANEALRVQLHDARLKAEKFQNQAKSLEQELELLKSRHPDLTALGGQRWKSEVAARLYEEKLAFAEKEIKSKSHMIDTLKKQAK